LIFRSTTTDYPVANYIVPWCRFSPYIIGVVYGYLLHITKDSSLKWSKEVVNICWITAAGLGVGSIYGLDFSQLIEGTSPSTIASAFYSTLHRVAWGLALGWIVFACSRGYGGK